MNVRGLCNLVKRNTLLVDEYLKSFLIRETLLDFLHTVMLTGTIDLPGSGNLLDKVVVLWGATILEMFHSVFNVCC